VGAANPRAAARVNLPGFEQQNHFPDQELVRRNRQRAVDWKFAGVDALDVLLPSVEVLVMNALEVTERCHAGTNQIGAAPERVAVDKPGMALRLDQGIAAGNDISRSLEFAEGIIDPCPFRRPTGDGRFVAGTLGFTSDCRVERNFHLVDGAGVGVHRDGLGDGLFPFVGSLAEHAGDEIDIDLRKADLSCPGIRPQNLRRAMGTAVNPEHFVVEVLHAETEARDADFLDRLEFRLFERAWLALEGDFAGRFPRPVFVDPLDEPLKLGVAQIRRRPTAEVDELKLPVPESFAAGIEGDFLRKRFEVSLDLISVLIGVDAEVAELASFAAEWNVQVQPQRRLGLGRGVQSRLNCAAMLRRPDRKRRIIGDKVAPDLGLLLFWEGFKFHVIDLCARIRPADSTAL
jgi:hypothetical protein